MKIQKEFDPIQGTTTVRIEKTREDVTPVVTYKEFISKGIENADGEIVNQRLENVLPENVATTLFQETLSDGTDIKAAVAAVTAKATIEYAEKNGQRAVIEMKYRQPTGDAAEGTGSTGRTVATPRITISAEGSVTITASEGDVFYTTNGSNPTSSSTAYTAAFTVADGTTVKAIAVVVEADPETGDDVEYVSSVATKKYTAASSGDPTPPPSTDFTYHYGKALYNRTVVNGGFEGLTAEDLAEHILNDPTNHFTGTASTTARLEVTPPAKVTNDVFSGLAQNYVAIPEGKVPAAIKNITVNANGLMSDADAAKVIIEKNTKGAQIPMYMKTVSLNGENYVVFFGWGDTTATCVFNPASL